MHFSMRAPSPSVEDQSGGDESAASAAALSLFDSLPAIQRVAYRIVSYNTVTKSDYDLYVILGFSYIEFESVNNSE